MPVKSQAQFRLMAGVADGSIKDSGMSKSVAQEMVDSMHKKKVGALPDHSPNSKSTGAGPDAHGVGGAAGYLVPGPGQHLPYTTDSGAISHGRMAAARAALTSNFRGHSYQGPDKSAALTKVKGLYAKEGMKW